MKFLLPLLALLLLATPAMADVPQAGQAAPGFTLQADDGRAVSLTDFKGKWLVLYFYPMDGTSVCSLQARRFQADLEKYKALGAEVVGVSVDDAASHAHFRAGMRLTFTLLSDPEAIVSALYGSTVSAVFSKLSARNTFVIDPAGVVRRVYLSVEPMTHSGEVLADLAALQKK
jgi:thioredoxin-dependent peroxiredoxin